MYDLGRVSHLFHPSDCITASNRYHFDSYHLRVHPDSAVGIQNHPKPHVVKESDKVTRDNGFLRDYIFEDLARTVTHSIHLHLVRFSDISHLSVTLLLHFYHPSLSAY